MSHLDELKQKLARLQDEASHAGQRVQEVRRKLAENQELAAQENDLDLAASLLAQRPALEEILAQRVVEHGKYKSLILAAQGQVNDAMSEAARRKTFIERGEHDLGDNGIFARERLKLQFALDGHEQRVEAHRAKIQQARDRLLFLTGEDV